MPNTDMETCRRCGKTGYKIDEFLEYWTGLCKSCYTARDAAPSNPSKNPAATVQQVAVSCKNQPEQIRRYTRQHLEDLESTYRVLGTAALLDYLEGHMERERERERKKREADGERGPGSKNP